MVDVQAYARSHGGEIHLVNVTVDGEVQVRLSGACQGCPLSDITLKKGIELNLKRMVPGVQKVVQVR
ncbi:MAG: NifU family protein [Fimbriimonadaceae bacterium]|nr:NifU family protein [Fimbriimonadaceae bacterium]